ncbi:MAG TPA: D-2-hydroxyacid dehydrogenase [bacterium]|nr:D-2-hydroxyacid dehydrogenase [bacterium]
MDELRVHSTLRLPDDSLARIRGVAPRIRLTSRPLTPYEPPAGMERDLADVEVLLSYHAAFEMAAAPRLRWLQMGGDGVDHLRGRPVLQSDVLITNARIFDAPIAEYVIASMIAYFRAFPRMLERFQRGRVWPANQWDEYAGQDAAGKTMIIVGYGSIGRKLARIARSLDMTVLATRRSAASPVREDGVEVRPPHALRELLPGGDVVVVCLPLTDETEGSIGEAELRAMKRTAYLINIGRGKVIDEAALLRALREGWIGGAGLDVHARTPLPPDSPFFDLPNVILTPHMSGISQGYYARVTDLVCENLRRYMTGAPLLNVVDKQKGY